MSRLAIVSAIGSRGDVNPMLAIGRELRCRGWRVLFITSEPYVPVAQAAGLETHAIISAQRFAQFISTPGLWSPIEGIRVVLADTATELIRPTIELLTERYEPGNTTLVAHPLDFGSRIFKDLHPEVRLVGTALAPMVFRTPEESCRLSPWWFEVRKSSFLVRTQYYIADRLCVDRWLGKPINEVRDQLGLPAVRRVLNQWYLSPDLVLGMFPEWFSPRRELLPEQVRHVGFPLEDAGPGPEDEHRQVQSILSQFDKPPIVFAPGTANMQAAEFFRSATESCRELGECGLLLTEHSGQIPSTLPKNVRHESYVPFRALLPHCAAIVHHGGIGTTSQSLAAGTPQVVVAMAFDQFDNGERVERLGVGKMLVHRRFSTRRLTSALRALLASEATAESADEIARRCDHVQATEVAADLIEQD